VVAAAVEDAERLAEAGFPALMVENFGDAPFFPDDVPAVTVASMSRAVLAVGQSTGLAVGVNVLRNDALSALAVAAASGAQFVRVNVLIGTMYTDQGAIQGRSAEVARLRRELCPDTAILADVMVKHAIPPVGLTVERAAADTLERGGADALIISGEATGAEVDAERVRRIRRLLPSAHILVGSGVGPDAIGALSEFADGAIVGSWLKVDGKVDAPVDTARARKVVEAASAVGWV
jgi:membrane complex biogenesis BtpA family protein